MEVGVGEDWGLGVSVAAGAAVGEGSAPGGCSTGPQAIKTMPARSVREITINARLDKRFVFKVFITGQIILLSPQNGSILM
jgi:hypothetical protein